MRKLLILALLLVPTFAYAQSQRNPCFINEKGGCTPVGIANPMPVTSGDSSQDVNINSIGGNAVTTTIPVSGNVGITGTPNVAVVGATGLATGQVSVTTGSTLTVASRTGRRSVIITNVTGTQPIYCSSGTATTANGQFIPGLIGASLTLSYSGTINCIASTSAQIVSVSEIY